MSEGKELSTETRSLIAAVLCLLVIAGWSLIYKPPQPTPTKPNPVTPAPASVPPAGPLPAPSRASTKTEPVVAMHSAGEERSVVIESDLYRVQISNRGATVRSWQLTKFTDDHTPPRTLDLVHADVAQQEGGWPLSLALDDTQQETALNNALFEIKSSGSVPQAGDVLHPPADAPWRRRISASPASPHCGQPSPDHLISLGSRTNISPRRSCRLRRHLLRPCNRNSHSRIGHFSTKPLPRTERSRPKWSLKSPRP